MSTQPQQQQNPVSLPDIPALAVNAIEAALLTTEGEIITISHEQAKAKLHKTPVLVCHAPHTRARLGAEDLFAFDLLELYAFVHPATFCVPTAGGLAYALGLTRPKTLEDQVFSLLESARALLEDFRAQESGEKQADPLEIARVMGQQGKGWPWTPFIFDAAGKSYNQAEPVIAKTALNIWKHLPEWAEEAPPPPPSHHPVTGEESRERLKKLLEANDFMAEPRTQQIDYAAKMTAAFAPLGDESNPPHPAASKAQAPHSSHPSPHREEGQDGGDGHLPPPHLILAEAGTGVGKTLGYIAPASVWAEKNEGTVWISTYTKNLQRQIDQELGRLYPDPAMKEQKIAVRKGRENYLCLLNMEEAAAGAALAKHTSQAVAAGLMARWAEASKSGDLSGGDFPGWLPGLIGYQHSLGLADKRGECIYSACDHYHKCFVERAARKARHADLVVANHALVMVKAVIAGPDDPLPQRYVFDEGHHLFDAADSAFAGHLTARETHDLRRWIKGAEGGKRSRSRGLKRRAEDLVAGDAGAEKLLEDIIFEANALPAHSWSRRLKDKAPQGQTEKFLMLVYEQVYARARGRDGPYSIETGTHPLIEELPEATQALKKKLRAIQTPMRKLSALLRRKLAEQAETLDSDTRKRLESVAAAIDRRSEHILAGWIAMLETLEATPLSLDPSPHRGEGKEGQQYSDWMEIERIDGRAIDVGFYRHWIDPMLPFAKSILPFAHGIAVTSATLRDKGDTHEDGADQSWQSAFERTGAPYINTDTITFSAPSPFDYAAQSRIFVVNDVRKDDMDQVASAYRVLFEACNGGGLGLFTAIQRLREVQSRIALPLEQAGIHLYAQHIDRIDTGTLVDIFREEKHACLLGTDAVRDGVDVPGESLRLLIYDRVPWPRPTILHKARRNHFGGRRYDEMITRLKLRQAYGRLIRRSTDKGVFVMLDSMLPTRLCDAFPEGEEIQRIGLADTANAIREFLTL